MRHLFIINPAAGKKDSTPRLEALLDKLSFPHEVVYTTGEGHARLIAQQAAAEGQPVRIYACGGDGTLNEVVNGAAGHDHVAITCIPKGTGNDFLKLFGPDYRTVFYDLEGLAAGPQSAFDLMDCNGLLGIDVVCAGVDARIGAGVHRYKNWHFVSGAGAYILSLLENGLFKGLTRPLRVRMGEHDLQGESTLLCVCNGRYYGGGFMPVSDAMPNDGVLDMVYARKVPLLKLPFLIGKYATGQYESLSRYAIGYHGRQVTFSSEQEIVAVVDGEVMRDKQFTVRLSEKKVNFFYPAQACIDGIPAADLLNTPRQAADFSTPCQSL